VFSFSQVLEVVAVIAAKRKLSLQGRILLTVQAFGVAGVVGVALLALILPAGYFGPLSSRVRGLFVKHTRTGNPLVDSVAEHQPASAQVCLFFLIMGRVARAVLESQTQKHETRTSCSRNTPPPRRTTRRVVRGGTAAGVATMKNG
jgi:hypothetical protein